MLILRTCYSERGVVIFEHPLPTTREHDFSSGGILNAACSILSLPTGGREHCLDN